MGLLGFCLENSKPPHLPLPEECHRASIRFQDQFPFSWQNLLSQYLRFLKCFSMLMRHFGTLKPSVNDLFFVDILIPPWVLTFCVRYLLPQKPFSLCMDSKIAFSYTVFPCPTLALILCPRTSPHPSAVSTVLVIWEYPPHHDWTQISCYETRELLNSTKPLTLPGPCVLALDC